MIKGSLQIETDRLRAAFDKRQRVEEKSNPGICIREKRRYLHCRAVLEAF